MRNKNVDFLGMMNLLNTLLRQGVITEKERKKLAARLQVETGADIIIPA